MGLTGTMRTHQHLVSGAKIGVFFDLWGMNANFDAKNVIFLLYFKNILYFCIVLKQNNRKMKALHTFFYFFFYYFYFSNEVKREVVCVPYQ